MANAWKEVGWIAAEALSYMEDALVITQLTARDKTAEFNKRPNGYRVGSSLDIMTNPVYEAKEFVSAIEIQDIRSSSRTLTIEMHFDVSVAMTAKEKRLNMHDFSELVVRPAAYTLAEKMDRYVATKILEGAGMYVSDNLLTTASDMALAKRAATLQQLSPTGRFAIVDDLLEAQLLGADYFATHSARGESGERVFNNGNMGVAMGMEWYSSLNFDPDDEMSAFTAGGGTGVTATAPTGDENKVGTTSLVLDSAATGTFEDGDRISIAGARRPLIVDGQQVTPTAIALRDPITEIIPSGAAVTVVGAGQTITAQGAIFDDKSIALAVPMLDPASDKPTGVVNNNGYSIRVVQGYDMNAKTETISLDLLCGAKAADPRRITLLASY